MIKIWFSNSRRPQRNLNTHDNFDFLTINEEAKINLFFMLLAKIKATSLCSRNTNFLFFNCFKKLSLKLISQSDLDSNFYTNNLKPLSFAFNFCYRIVAYIW